LTVIYLDTSVVVPLFVHEPGSASILGWLESSSDALASSDWMLTEFSSALAIKVRSRAITLKVARDASREFERFCQENLPLAAVTREAFREAALIATQPDPGIRAADALHLAMAREMGARAIATADVALARCAESVGLRALRF
jgi:hypothetical protein